MRVALLVLCAVTAACGGPEPDVNARNASVAEVAEKVRDATKEPGFIRPGKWVSELSFEEMSAPNMPAEVREQMQGMLAARRTFDSCLTAEQAKRPQEDFFAGGNNNCRYEHFRMGGGKIDAKMRCQQDGMTQLMELDGQYSPDKYQMRMSTRTQGQAGSAGDIVMRMRVDARRVGECEARQS